MRARGKVRLYCYGDINSFEGVCCHSVIMGRKLAPEVETEVQRHFVFR